MSASDPGFDLEAGTSDFYVDATYYDFEFRHRTYDVKFYAERYAAADGPVLELGVGTGRIALRAVRQGATVVGIDFTQTMLDHAAERRAKLPKGKQANLELVQGDMRDFDLKRTFPLVTCPFNAFMHLYTVEDVQRTLACVDAHLAPNGRFMFDVLLPDFEYLNRPAFKRYPGVRFKHPTYGVEYVYSEQSDYDPVTQVNQMWFHYDRGEPSKTAPAYFCIQLSHRYHFPRELEAVLHYNGFEIETRYGDFDGAPVDRSAESMVLVCKRRGDV